MGKNILVTGGAGFIGSHVVERHVKEGNNVIIVDDLSMGSRENIVNSDHVIFYQKSITDYEFMSYLLKKYNFNVIYLLAAIASVADTIKRPYESHQVNQEANLFIMETLRINKLFPERVLFSSSAATYGALPKLPKKEDGAVLPATPYAIDKYATERYILTYAHLYNIPTVAVRFFNVYGPRQNPKSPYSGVLSIVSHCLKQNVKFSLFGDGLQTRDFIYIKDVISALKLAETTDKMIGDVFNVATGSSHTLLDAIADLEMVSGKKLQIKKFEPRIGDIRDSKADISKLKSFGFRPKYTFSEGAKAYWDSL
ncbi:NAD-dependent epimerase/dehydratase family protein [Weissella paramesenteroides]|uniref:NAD dependent epimerase/dehydratase family protein n=1 Tax=Weissella paramesenteroides ATCC 33313 TaxID=585506 RepID=C5RB69_WEIPA|nr:NAD-dependent epimerase/dehydratase family protein [Weissella paramesenteroides]ATF41869.1 epimerase [Weissella paramesenteroides]EER74738.1 NAD dependent epimerase/dehydratase family protein [Weissella paramesenteroides ATCC 33313]